VRIVLFTPIARASAIGRVSRLVVRALESLGHEVQIVRTELDEQVETHRIDADVLSWRHEDSVVTAGLAADICVFQVGDNYPFHAGCVTWLPVLPGVVCLHDHFVGHLFDSWASARGVDPGAVVRAWYGDEVARQVQGLTSPADLAARSQLAPMTEWIAAQAIGVLTHGEWVLDRVLRACPGPVRWAPLPYELARVPIEPSQSAPGRFRLLTVGHMNPNKRIASVLEAIGTDAVLHDRVVYTLVGPVADDERQMLESVATRFGVELSIAGQASERVLAGAIADAHAIAALRWPSTEAASASTIEAMLAGKPTLVTKAGFYDSLPDDCVIKIDHDNEIAEIRAALRRLVDEPSSGRAIGARARSHAEREHRAEPYALTLVALAQDALAVAAPLATIRQATETLARWSGEGGLTSVGADFIFEPLMPLWTTASSH
jgi:glycosyltransferase involved in cell wall biosynthesis